MSVVLNIGKGTGALVLYTKADLEGREIEISRLPDGATAVTARTHAVVRRRDSGSATVFAAVYPDLQAGDYTVWRDTGTQATTATVAGGSVSSCHWPG